MDEANIIDETDVANDGSYIIYETPIKTQTQNKAEFDGPLK